LLGAVTLVLLAVVFIPMFLDSEPRPQRTTPSLDIPPKENVAPLPAPTPAAATKIVVADKAPASASGEVDVPAKPSSAPATAATPPTPPPASSAATPPASPPQPAAKVTPIPSKNAPDAPPKAAPKLEGFAVQVGAFRDEAKLKQAREKVAAAKMSAYTEPSGDLTRLRVGPFSTREEAERAAATLRHSVPDAKVVPAQ